MQLEPTDKLVEYGMDPFIIWRPRRNTHCFAMAKCLRNATAMEATTDAWASILRHKSCRSKMPGTLRLEEFAHCTLTHNGFELCDHSLSLEMVDFFDHGQVLRNYYPCCAEQFREASRADLVIALDHNVRSASSK